MKSDLDLLSESLAGDTTWTPLRPQSIDCPVRVTTFRSSSRFLKFYKHPRSLDWIRHHRSKSCHIRKLFGEQRANSAYK